VVTARAVARGGSADNHEHFDEQAIDAERVSGAKVMKTQASSLSVLTFILLAGSSATAQQINGVPGSPGATETIDGLQLPPPPLPFGGVIKESAKDSTPY
jgi:hypothetical protein